MKVTVEYAAQVKRAAGCAAETIELDSECSMQQLLAQVAARHNDSLHKLLFDPQGVLHPSILVFVGDEQVRWDQPIKLRDKDVVTILSPISGG